MNARTIPKFRPVLSANQISHILALARRDGSSDSIDVIRALGMFEYKMQNEIVKPSHISETKPPLAESLGFTDSPTVNHISGEISDEVLYNLWMKEPSALTVTQLKAVRAYRYKENKMTMDEEKAFEKEVMGVEI